MAGEEKGERREELERGREDRDKGEGEERREREVIKSKGKEG